MRFTLIKDLKRDPTMKPILAGLVSFILLYLISDIFVKKITIGLYPHDVKQTLFGNEEEFIEPLTQGSFLEFLHIEIFFVMMILLTLSAVYIRLRSSRAGSSIILHIVMISAILSILSIFAAYFASETFVYVYVLSFLIWHIFAIYMAISSFWSLYYE